MRIFPEGAGEWLEPTGKVLCIVSAFALIVGMVWFLRQHYIWHEWPTTDGVMAGSKLVTGKGEGGGTVCSAVYLVRYSVNGTTYASDEKETSSSSDCEMWKAKVASAQGAHRTVLFDREHPSDAYINPGYNINFFFLPFFSLCLGLGFALFGLIAWKLGQFMERRKLQLP